VFRRNYCGDFEANRKRLVHYLLFFRPEIDATHELDWLEQQTWAWLQATLNRDGLQPIARAVDGKGENLIGTLAPCLLIPLFWAYVRWRRCQANSPVHDRIRFFELQARTRLNNQFQRHIRALAHEYNSRRRVEQTDLDDITTTAHLP
jgi:hypothetical protein